MTTAKPTVSENQGDGTQRHSWSVLAFALAAIGMLTLVPITNIVTIIATTGTDCLSNDYLAYV